MQLIHIEKLEDCFDGSMIFRYSFEGRIDETLMKKLGEKGKLDYYPDFPRPFFKIVTPGGIQVKGIIGDTDFEVVFPLTDKWQKKEGFETYLERITGRF